MVIMPPRMVAYESGMSSRDGATPYRPAIEITAGIITITTGVLLMNGDTSKPTASMANSSRRSLRPAIAPSQSPRRSTQPVLLSAPLMMNRQAMVIGALLLKTLSTCFGDSRPRAMSRATALITAISGFSHSRTKHANRAIRVRPTITAWRDSGSGIDGSLQ
jgi:hypothetical protein